MLATNLKNLKPGEEITDFFVIRKKELRVKKADRAPYLALELGNASGRISATIWDDVKDHVVEYQVGDIVKVLAKVVDYKNANTLVIEKIRKAREEDEVQPANFLPCAKKDLNELNTELAHFLQSVQDEHIRGLLEKLFSSEKFRTSYATAPAGKLWHHNRIAGLIEHSLSVASICDFLAQKYEDVNRDLLIAGALLHDIGKIQSYKTDQGFIDYSDEGRLLGHLMISADWVTQILKTIPDFPDEHRKQLLHLILSHHGELANGSPVVPMTLEALILYYADELDSKIDAFHRIAEAESFPNSRWSHFVKLLDRFLYLPPENEVDSPGETD